MKARHSNLLAGVATLAMLATAAPAMAQTADDGADTAAGASGSGNEIIVTAQKRAQNIQDVPSRWKSSAASGSTISTRTTSRR